MRRRSHLTILLIALLMVGASIVPTSPRDSAQAADPLADAKAEQKALEKTLSAQRAALAALKTKSAKLTKSARHREGRAGRGDRRVQPRQRPAGAGEGPGRRDHGPPGGPAGADRRPRPAAAGAGGPDRAADRRAGDPRVAPPGAHALRLRAQPDIAPRADPLVGLARRRHDPGRLPAHHLGPGSAARRRDPRPAREPAIQAGHRCTRGRVALAATRDQADAEAQALADRQAELAAMEAELADAQGCRGQEATPAGGRAQRGARGEAATWRPRSPPASRRPLAQARLVAKLQAEEDARRQQPSAFGFRWPEDSFHVTQEWGPTTFLLEGPYTYRGTYYPHFHGGIDLANGCGTPIRAVGSGTVVGIGPAALAVGLRLWRGDQPRLRRAELVLAPEGAGRSSAPGSRSASAR